MNTTTGTIRKAVLVGAIVLWGSAAHAQSISCAMSPAGGGDTIGEEGFYVTNFPGTGLTTVVLTLSSNTPGAYQVSLTAHANAFNGPQIGTTQTANVTLDGSFVPGTTATFDFGGAPVTPGSTVTFTSSLVSGPGVAFFNIGPGPIGDATFSGCPNFIETEDTTTLPLSTFRRASVGATISYVAAVPAMPVPTLAALAFVLAALVVVRLRQSRPASGG